MYLETFGITMLVFFASLLLSIIIVFDFVRSRRNNLLFWSVGMWLFTLSVLLEILFAGGVFSELLIDLYLFMAAVLVQFLALGSVFLLKSVRDHNLYTLYCAITDAFMIYALASTHVGNIIQQGVVSGLLPLTVTEASILITFPGAILLVLIALLSYRRRRDPKLLSIVAGTIVVSVAGTLYIAAFPSLLYLAELAGIILLWLGFVDLSALFKVHRELKHVDS